MEFVNVDLLCNKLNIWLLANDSITHIKKKRILKIKDKIDKLLKVKVI